MFLDTGSLLSDTLNMLSNKYRAAASHSKCIYADLTQIFTHRTEKLSSQLQDAGKWCVTMLFQKGI